jgi:hypothetical protein
MWSSVFPIDIHSALIGYAVGITVAAFVVLSTYDFKKKGR